MCLWNAAGKHLNMTNHCHHHHYHHYYPHDAVTAGRPQITKWLQTRWLRDEGWWLKRGKRERGKEEERGEEGRGNDERHGKNMRPRGQGGGRQDLRHAVIEECRSRTEGWQRRERERERVYQYASQSHRGAAGWGREMGHETAIMSSLLLQTQ